MGNRPSTPSVESLLRVQSQVPNSNFRTWAYWSRLDQLDCFRRTTLTPEDFKTVLIFLQMGNFTGACHAPASPAMCATANRKREARAVAFPGRSACQN
jgi:hypothetical protein